MNPTLLEMMARTRISEIRRAATRPDGARGHVDAMPAGTTWTVAGTHGSATRQTIGWFLVRVGLRLARPRPASAR